MNLMKENRNITGAAIGLKYYFEFLYKKGVDFFAELLYTIFHTELLLEIHMMENDL